MILTLTQKVEIDCDSDMTDEIAMNLEYHARTGLEDYISMNNEYFDNIYAKVEFLSSDRN